MLHVKSTYYNIKKYINMHTYYKISHWCSAEKSKEKEKYIAMF